MYQYDGFYGKWEFDWDAVVYHAPEYRKYVVEGTVDWRGVVIEKQCQPEEYNTSAGTIRIDTSQLQMQDDGVVNAYGRHVSNFSDEDEAVIALMRGNESPVNTTLEPEEPLAPNELRAADPDVQEQPRWATAQLHEEAYLDGKKRKQKELGERSKYRKRFTLKYEHANAYAAPSTPIVPLLPPPKFVLANSSEYRLNPLYSYLIAPNRWFEDRAIVTVYGMSEDDTYIRVFKYKFNLNKAWGSSKRMNKDRCRVVFNKKTGNLFSIKYEREKEDKRGKHKLRITGISSQVSFLSICFGELKGDHVAQFVQKMWAATHAYLGGPVHVPQTDLHGHTPRVSTTVLSLLWQYKTKTYMPWLSEDIFNAIETIRGSYSAYGKDHIKDLKKRSLIKMLKKKTHPSTVIKYLLGPLYSTTAYKMIMSDASRHMHVILPFLQHMSENKMLHHFISNVLGMEDSSFVARMINAVSGASGDMRHYGAQKPHDEELRIFDKYIKMHRKFIETNGVNVHPVTWHTFRDTFGMAKRFNISINLSKINCGRDIQELHDRFSAYIQRDKNAARALQGKPFLPFAHPDKDYNGFMFEFLGTVEDLIHEGRVMKHCVGGYGWRCSDGSSIIFSMRKEDTSLITIEIDGRDLACRIVQMYTRHDITVTNEDILKLVEQWRQDLVKMHRADRETYADRIQLVAKFVSNASLLKLDNHPPEITQALINEKSELLGELDARGLKEYANKIVASTQKQAFDDLEEETLDPFQDRIPVVRAPVAAVPVPGSPAEADHNRIMNELRRLREQLEEFTRRAMEACHV